MEKKISVIIPNFNGRELLAQNLPKVIATCQDCEIIVVDDGSTDDSESYIKRNFKKIKVIKNPKNLGFARSSNIGAKKAQGQLLLLFNSDVAPRPNFLKSAIAKFTQNENLFAVGLADQSHENGKIVTRGRGGANFAKGFVSHFALKPKADETLWVSGGSALFDQEKFESLGGFDPVFAPFYWEDIDLSWRARKQGLICLFDADAKVDHFHEEGAIKRTHSLFFIKTVAYKNQFLFVWKNISDYAMISQHLLWLPYHFAKALVTFDWPFFLGILWAFFQIPVLILNYQLPTTYQLTDKEVLSRFEKQ